MKNGARAFSLAELVLCLGILAIALISITSLFIGLFRSSDKSSHSATGESVAITVLNKQLHDIFLGLHPTLTKAAFFASDSPPAITGSLVLSNTEYQYQIDHVTIQSAVSGGDLGAGLSGNRLKAVTVTCWWWGNAGSNRAGQGKLMVQTRMLVNENDQF